MNIKIVFKLTKEQRLAIHRSMFPEKSDRVASYLQCYGFLESLGMMGVEQAQANHCGSKENNNAS